MLAFTCSDDSSEDPPPSPSKLCPYCDELLPPNPSRQLQHLLQTLLMRSTLAPRPGNALARDARAQYYTAVCSVHRAESSTIPDGLAQGWPANLDFAQIPERMQKPKLRQILNDIVYGSDSENRGFFWAEATRRIKTLGSRAAGSIQGQYATFEELQPG